MSLPSMNWNYPTNMKTGAGRVTELPDYCRSLGMRNPLVVTDPGLARLPLTARIVDICKAAGLSTNVFSDVKGNPTGENVASGVDVYHQGGHDGVIALGGGSALDAGKAIALMVGQERSLWDFEDVGDNYLRVNEAGMAPVVAIPTTAGTGSEVGRSSVIVDQQAHVKRIIFHANMLPAIVLLDPELTFDLPARLTAATGVDALSHNLEAVCSKVYHPMAQGIGMEGCRLVHAHLLDAVTDGHDVDARYQMLVASSMGATAFQKGLGAMHALAHPLGALYDAHHGTLIAIVMPYVLKANESAISDAMTALARHMGLAQASFAAVLDRVLELREQVGIPHSLREIGIPDDAVHKVGAMSIKDASAATNPIPFSEAEYNRILGAALDGKL